MELIKLTQAFIFLLLLWRWVNGNSLMGLEESSVMCEAFEALGGIVTYPNTATVDVISSSSSSSSRNEIKCLTEWVMKKDFVMTTSHNHLPIQPISINKWKKKNVAIILDGLKSLKLVLQNMTSEVFNFHGRFLIILTQNTVELDLMFELFWRRFIYNVNIMAEDNGSVTMYTFFPFTNSSECHKSKPVKINSFVNGSWSSQSFFIPKLRNFHKCPLKAACYQYGPSAQQTIHSDGSMSLNGSDIEILKGLAKILNAKLEVELLTAIGSWGQIWENGSASGAFKSIINGDVDICANFYYLSELRSKFMQFTSAYYSLSLMMMIPRGAPYSALQMLLRPFKPTVWIYFTVFILMTFVAVAAIKRRARNVQFIFFDRNINSPIVGMVVIILGGSQSILPRRNFSRLLMMSFVLFCFVLRTSYEGSIFKFLQVKQAKWRVKFSSQTFFSTFSVRRAQEGLRVN